MNSLQEKTVVVMGLAPRGIAIAIGQEVVARGGRVIYSVQSDRHFKLMKHRGFSSEELEHIEKQRVCPCDVTDKSQIQLFFENIGEIGEWVDGLAHCLAFAKPKTMLGDSLFEANSEDIASAFDVSAASLVHVMKYAQPYMRSPSSVVALTFESQRILPGYAWMHHCKAALDAAVRGLAYELGGEGIRVNAVSAGPLDTMSAKAIPGFEKILEPWDNRSPLGWNFGTGRHLVAQAACDLLGSLEGVTGHILPVDGGFHLSMF
ncbi:MAG: SDR family oxidoreductase [bacterium]|nr:SDR family oxidoreductase [bacterium]